MTNKNKMILWLLIAILILPIAGCGGGSDTTPLMEEPEVKERSDTDTDTDTENRVILGNEQFDTYVPLLEGKRVALFSNHTGIVGDVTYGADDSSENDSQDLIHFGLDSEGNEISYGEHILDALIRHGVNVTAIFSPEHGFRGTEDAGANIDNSIDEKTGIPILSLYANNTHSPSSEDMGKFDTLVVDMQDVGLRYYTYYISMYYLMDACAAAGKEVIILDRPNPNGFYVDGPILKDTYKSGVGQLPIPVVYSMTWGELAQMINGEGWLTTGKNACNLTVIPCKNYTHQTKTRLIRNPSPNIKDMRAVYLYASTCFFENTAVSVGRGTEFPFEAYGSPYLKGVEGFDFTFTPVSMSGATEPPFMNETCYGVDLRGVPQTEVWENQINLDYLVSAYQAIHETSPDVSFWGTPDSQGRYWVDKLIGTNDVRLRIELGQSAAEIKDSWYDEIEAFKTQRKPYLLYEE